MSEAKGRGAGGVNRVSRIGTGLQVSLTVVLAVAAVLLLNWLAARPGLRQRFDLTSTSENTLSTATLGLLERLERDVRVEVLYRQERGTKGVLEADVMQRTMRMLQLVQDESGGRVAVEVVDTTDAQAWAQRALELRIQGFGNGLVISCGGRRVVLDLDGDLAQFREGRSAAEGYVPPSVVAFTAEESLVEGILDVTRGEILRVYFTSGSGEVDLAQADEEAPEGFGQFAEGLRREGFELRAWSILDSAEVPSDCEVLLILGPDAAWPDRQYDAVLDYAERGGRLVIVPAPAASALRRSDVPDLLEYFGLEVSEGRVAGGVVDPRTGLMVDGIVQCEVVDVLSQTLSTHPIVAPFREAGRNLRFYQAHRLRVRAQPKQGVAQNLITTTRNDLWVDAPTGPDLVGDLRYDGAVDGATGRIPIAATVQRPPSDGSGTTSGLEAIKEVRVVGFGSLYSFSNAALQGASVLPAALNWVADREHRIAVPPRDPDLRLMPRDDPSAMVRVTRFAQFHLPGAVALIGLLVWFRRTRGSRRRAAASKEASSS